MQFTNHNFFNKKGLTLLVLLFAFLSNPLLSQNRHPVPQEFGNNPDISFYPIGWSKNGKFAYIFLKPSGMRGSYYNLIIQNVKSDKILVDIDLEQDRGYGYNSYEIQGVWKETFRKFEDILDRHDIVPQRYSNRFRDISTKNNYEYKLSYREKCNEDGCYGFSLKVYNEDGSKRVTDVKLGSIDNIRFFGAIKSPFENRIVIITQYNGFDWQGDPDGISLYLSGCHLSAGFR